MTQLKLKAHPQSLGAESKEGLSEDLRSQRQVAIISCTRHFPLHILRRPGPRDSFSANIWTFRPLQCTTPRGVRLSGHQGRIVDFVDAQLRFKTLFQAFEARDLCRKQCSLSVQHFMNSQCCNETHTQDCHCKSHAFLGALTPKSCLVCGGTPPHRWGDPWTIKAATQTKMVW